jgi:WD40 repeat protein
MMLYSLHRQARELVKPPPVSTAPFASGLCRGIPLSIKLSLGSSLTKNQCWGLAWSPNDDEVATVGDDGSVRIWDVSVKAQQIRLHGREGRLTMDNDHRLLFNNKPLTTSELQDLAVQKNRSPSHA